MRVIIIGGPRYTLIQVLFVLSIALQSKATFFLNVGRCPDFEVQKNFNLSAYQGTWYVLGGYRTESVDGDKRCVSADYVYDETDKIVHVYNRGISNSDNVWSGVNGTAVLTDPRSDEAKLTVSFKFAWWTIKGPYWVLGTDYNKYAVVYTCKNFLFFFHYYTIRLLGREQQFGTVEAEQDYFNSTYSVLSKYKISSSIIGRSNQTNCEV